MKSKNIHVLKTDKPTWVHKSILTGILRKSSSCIDDMKQAQGMNIYIASDEEIKDGDYGICLNLVREGFKSHQAVFKMDAEQRQAMNELGGQKKAEVLKVILTTDQDLIKDGVQAIDDEFLEWYVKNPSCDFAHLGFKSIIGDSETKTTYKIIIPKEEQDYTALLKQVGTKQETLEEVAENELRKQNWDTTITLPFNGGFIEGFQQGAKWQAERVYSEEEIIQLLMKFNQEITEVEDVRIWFEQFKKK